MQRQEPSQSEKRKSEEKMAAMERAELSSDIKEKSHSEILTRARRLPKNINFNLPR